jgi:hypothetical protein
MASRGNLWTGHAFWHAPPGLWIRSCFYATEYLAAENRILRAQVLRRHGIPPAPKLVSAKLALAWA